MNVNIAYQLLNNKLKIQMIYVSHRAEELTCSVRLKSTHISFSSLMSNQIITKKLQSSCKVDNLLFSCSFLLASGPWTYMALKHKYTVQLRGLLNEFVDFTVSSLEVDEIVIIIFFFDTLVIIFIHRGLIYGFFTIVGPAIMVSSFELIYCDTCIQQ